MKALIEKLDEAYNAIGTADSASIENLLAEEFGNMVIEHWPEIKASLLRPEAGFAWIPAGERMPEYGDGLVLCTGLDPDGNRWQEFISATWLRENPTFATHWMPLPPSPQPQRQSTMAEDIARQIEDGAPGDSQSNR